MSSFRLGEDEGRSARLQAMLKRRGFFFPSYDIYGGVAGLYDLGPMGSLMMDNMISIWKRRFVSGEGFLLLDSPSLAPEAVFANSGHLEKFSDHMTRCTVCGEPFRADQLLEGALDNPDALKEEELEKALRENLVRCPVCGGELGPVEEFNLMFKTFIGPGTGRPAYLRPETAQSIFLDFSLLFRFNRERMPFGVAQVGKGFRNEISPRQGLLRQREFHMAEGEFFFDPLTSGYPPFSKKADMEVPLVPGDGRGKQVRMRLFDAVSSGLICSEVLAYFMGITFDLAVELGIPDSFMRFRQHLETEMAHYARDCWDLEVLTVNGWVEMVGIADRSAYDLERHMEGSGQDLSVLRRYREPLMKEQINIEVNMKELGPLFRGAAGEVSDAVSEMDPSDVEDILGSGKSLKVRISSGEVEVPRSAVSVRRSVVKVSGERFIPHVVEPSFGLDRLMVAILEHAYSEEEEEKGEGEEEVGEGPYAVLRLKPEIAPVKCGIFPLMNRDGLPEIAGNIDMSLRGKGLMTHYDASGSIGRRYARMDEIGTPFCITVDYDTPKDGTVTVRDRDTRLQKRVAIDVIPETLSGLISGSLYFPDL